MRVLLDTNIVLYALRNEPQVVDWMRAAVRTATEVAVSVISRIELLGYPHLGPKEEEAIREALSTMEEVPLSDSVVEQTISIRRKMRLKIPDAIVAASALCADCTLVTRNVSDFRRVPTLKTMDPFSI